MGALVLIIVGVVFALWMSLGSGAEVHDKFQDLGHTTGNLAVFLASQLIVLPTLYSLFFADGIAKKTKKIIATVALVCLVVLFSTQDFIRDAYTDTATDAEKMTLELKRVGAR